MSFPKKNLQTQKQPKNSHQPQRNFPFRCRNANSAHLWWFRIKKSLRTQTSHRSHYIFTLHESTVPFATSARVKIVQTLFGDVAKHSFRSWMESKAFHFASLLFPQWNEHVKAFSVNPMAVNERRKKCKQHVITLGFMRDTLQAQGGKSFAERECVLHSKSLHGKKEFLRMHKFGWRRNPLPDSPPELR